LLNRLIDYQMFSILRVDQAGENCSIDSRSALKNDCIFKHDVPLGRGVVGYAAQAKEAVLVPDVAKSDRYNCDES